MWVRSGKRANEGDNGDRESLYADHQRQGRFFNPWNPFNATPLRAFQAFLLTKNPYRASHRPRVARVANDGAQLARDVRGAQITWAGHATFAIQDGGDVILTDPHFGPRAAVVKRHYPPGFPLKAVPGHSMVVVSHNHYDHLDAHTVRRLPKSLRWFVPMGLGDWFRRRGVKRVEELDWWQSAKHGDWEMTCLPTQHWSRRLGQPANTTLACSWLLSSARRRYLFVGDSGYFHGFKEFGRLFAPIDVAILPIGAYAPRWFLRYQHMNPEEAWKAFLDLEARFMLPSHWGVFRLTHEPIDQPILDLRKAIHKCGGDPRRAPQLALGETWIVPPGG